MLDSAVSGGLIFAQVANALVTNAHLIYNEVHEIYFDQSRRHCAHKSRTEKSSKKQHNNESIERTTIKRHLHTSYTQM